MADNSTIFHPGDMVSNHNDDDDGSLGCFARASDGSTVVLSCAHVLFAKKQKGRNYAIYSPPPSSTCCRHQIATTLNTWSDGFDGPVTSVADNGPTDIGFFTD